MCGRYATTRGGGELSTLFEAGDETGTTLAPDYNVAPTKRVPIVRRSSGDRTAARVLSLARWGLLPPWARDRRASSRMINARAETVATSKAYAPSFARRRCLVPADGWYEWCRREGRTQVYFMTPRDGGVLALAGIWTAWGEGADRLLTCSVVTTAATGDLAAVHERMPLVLPPGRWASWLGEAGPDAAGSGPAGTDPQVLLGPPARDVLSALEIRPVGPEVGDVRNGGPALVARVAGAAPDTPTDAPTDLTLF